MTFARRDEDLYPPRHKTVIELRYVDYVLSASSLGDDSKILASYGTTCRFHEYRAVPCRGWSEL